ncbi:MAG: thioredoxin domain-containing protein [Deltaproteobacteria bacterium]
MRRVGLLACVLWVAACHEKAPADSANAPVAAAAAGGAGSCDQFVSQLCGRSGGDESALCTSAKELGKVLPASACLAAIKDFSQVERQIDVDRKVCTELMERLCKDLGPDTPTCAMVRAQTPQFPREHCEQLTGAYEQVLPELKKQEAQNQPLSAELQARIAGKGAPSFGPEDAKVTIVEFSDFQCPYCARAADVVHKIKERYADKVRFVFRQFPLPMHPDAHLAAEASLAAQRQGKFWEFHDLLFANQQALSREALEGYARQLKLNVSDVQRALDGQTEKAAVDADVSLGEGVQVNGTPTLFINGKRVANPTEFEPVAKQIDELLGS